MVVFVSVLVLWMISLCLHEYAHARVAYAGGDETVADKGYLSMNPLRYMHPFMSIILPLLVLALGGIALPGGAVYIDRSRLRSRHWESAVSAAGPAANLLVLGLCGIPFAIGLAGVDQANTFWPALAFLGLLQGVAVILNLLPIPGLDGFGILEPYLPAPVREQARSMGNAGFMILLLLLIGMPGFGDAIWDGAEQMAFAVGIPERAIEIGGRRFFEFVPRLF